VLAYAPCACLTFPFIHIVILWMIDGHANDIVESYGDLHMFLECKLPSTPISSLTPHPLHDRESS
jgi:hypothetical protein